jgi:hypothetical protein
MAETQEKVTTGFSIEEYNRKVLFKYYHQPELASGD